MSSVLVPSRRGFLLGLGAALFAAPAIVRASSLMAVKAAPCDFAAIYEGMIEDSIQRLSDAVAKSVIDGSSLGSNLLSINMLTREAIRLFQNSSEFLQSISSEFDREFAQPNAKIGTTLRIRLPRDFQVADTYPLAPLP